MYIGKYCYSEKYDKNLTFKKVLSNLEVMAKKEFLECPAITKYT